jgi:hypothetical protein
MAGFVPSMNASLLAAPGNTAIPGWETFDESDGAVGGE